MTVNLNMNPFYFFIKFFNIIYQIIILTYVCNSTHIHSLHFFNIEKRIHISIDSITFNCQYLESQKYVGLPIISVLNWEKRDRGSRFAEQIIDDVISLKRCLDKITFVSKRILSSSYSFFDRSLRVSRNRTRSLLHSLNHCFQEISRSRIEIID